MNSEAGIKIFLKTSKFQQMKAIKNSSFKNSKEDKLWFNNWVSILESNIGRKYERIEVFTTLGKTHIWGLNTQETNLETLVIFPGARTTSLFWDFDRGLDAFGHKMRIFLIETNGLPNLSDGNTPDIKSLDYGHWASELFEQLGIDKAYIAGASFGGLICMKLCLVAPEKVRAAFLLNPGCLQPFSLKFKNLYYNLLPIISSKRKNVESFLDKAVFNEPFHGLSQQSKELIIEYEVFALTRYIDRTQKPYFMKDELKNITSDVYLLEGDKDLLFPYKKSIKNAKKHLHALKEIKVFENVGHGIETQNEALSYIGDCIKRNKVIKTTP